MGLVTSTLYVDDEMVDEKTFPNTVLRSGRRLLAAAMGGNLLSSGFDAFINRMAFGNGGTDMSNRAIKVPETATTFLGGASNIKDVVPTKAIMGQGDAPSVTFNSLLPQSALSNGTRVTQIGLMMANDSFYSITTWGGFEKDSSVSNSISWRLTWL